MGTDITLQLARNKTALDIQLGIAKVDKCI